MAEHTSRVGQRADTIRVTDVHEDYYDSGVPVLSEYKLDNGKVFSVVEKEIEAVTAVCQNCDIDIHYDDHAEPSCPRCGHICSGPDNERLRDERMVRDVKAAGRLPDDDT